MFVLDETSWVATQVDGYLERIEQLLDCMEQLRQDGQVCVFSEELFHIEVYQGQGLYELFASDGPISIPREIQERIAAEFGRLQAWGELARPWPVDFDVTVDQTGPVFAPSLAWAMTQAAQGAVEAVPCLIAADVWPSGLHAVTVAGEQAKVWLVSNVKDTGFYRWLATYGTNGQADLDELLSAAFPNLEFVQGCTDGIKDMSQSYRDLIEAIVHSLGVLSDEGQRIFSGPWMTAPAQFRPLGVDISDENRSTKDNKNAEREHTRIHNGRSMIFWWHIKLKPDRDRIHLDATEIHNGGKIIVGIFCRHLKV